MYNMLSPDPRAPFELPIPRPHSLLIFLHLFTFFDLEPFADARKKDHTWRHLVYDKWNPVCRPRFRLVWGCDWDWDDWMRVVVYESQGSKKSKL